MFLGSRFGTEFSHRADSLLTAAITPELTELRSVSYHETLVYTATHESAEQTPPREMANQRGRRSVLRPQGRHLNQRCSEAVDPVRDDPVGFPTSGEVQPQVSWAGRDGGSEQATDETGYDPSNDHRKFGEVYCDRH